ncbi:MAG: hypothetical protein ACUVUQ_09615 [Thermodesulfovibrionales bacterium]
MTNKTFIAELHDIGKLVDRQALNQQGLQISGHTFHNFDFSRIGILQPSSPSWYAQYLERDDLRPPDKDLLNSQEAIRCISDPEIRADVLLTKMADGISAAISRLKLYGKGIRRGQAGEGVYKLWNTKFYEEKKHRGQYWSPFTDIKSLKEMFQYIDSCLDYQDFFRKYREYLTLTPEDKTAPGNIVSLYTHLELVGKIYRTLKKHSLLQCNTQNLLLYNNQQIRSVQEAAGHIDPEKDQGKWIFRIVNCGIKFPQSFSRLQDLNVFRKRADLIKAFSEDENTKDYVLFFTDDFMCLFIPKEDVVRIHELLEPFLKAGFIIDYRELETELNLLTSSMERAYEKIHSLSSSSRYLKLYEKKAYHDFSPEIKPHLCDSCQMRHGKERIKDQIHEYLCDNCYGIREMGEPAREYAEWEEKGLRAGWMKITLDQEQLLMTLKRLYEEYVDTHYSMQGLSGNDKALLKESFRPLAVQMDFVEDYKLLLNAFNKQIYEIKDKDGNSLFTNENFLFSIENYYEFGIFKVYSGEDILAVLDLFYSLLERYFPECLKDSPIKLSISFAPVKYPYQEHWRFLSMPKNTINIQIPGSSKLCIDIPQYKLLREKIRRDDTRLSHFLHRLADVEIETKSNMMVMLDIFNNRKNFPALLELTQKGLSIHQILDFYKLTREVEISLKIKCSSTLN